MIFSQDRCDDCHEWIDRCTCEDVPGEDENNPEEFENTVDINGWT